jgi:hypothetical protein
MVQRAGSSSDFWASKITGIRRFDKLKCCRVAMLRSETEAFVKAITNHVILIIIGCVLLVNSKHTALLESEKYEAVLSDNIDLIGRLMIVIGIVRILIEWYMHAKFIEEIKQSDNSSE